MRPGISSLAHRKTDRPTPDGYVCSLYAWSSSSHQSNRCMVRNPQWKGRTDHSKYHQQWKSGGGSFIAHFVCITINQAPTHLVLLPHSNEHLRSNDKRTCPGNSDTCTLVRKVTHQSHGWWWDWEEQQEQRDQVMIATHKVESVYLRKLVEKSLSLNYYYYYGLANEGSECWTCTRLYRRYCYGWKTLNIIKIAFHGNLYPLFHHFTTLWLVYLHAEIQRVNWKMQRIRI